nr:MAG TPA: hypothetical protein [Caudoviricetes sp.]
MTFTQEQIESWKKKHGEIFELTIEDKSCIIRRPTRQEFSFVSGIKDPIQLSETLLKQLWIDGDKEILEDDAYFLPAISQLDEVLRQKEASVKKL